MIESVTSTGVVVQAQDNTTVTWDLKSDTVVREHGSRASTSALSDGERVFVAGPVVSGSQRRQGDRDPALQRQFRVRRLRIRLIRRPSRSRVLPSVIRGIPAPDDAVCTTAAPGARE